MDSLKMEREKEADVKFCLHILPLIVFIRNIQKGKRKKKQSGELKKCYFSAANVYFTRD